MINIEIQCNNVYDARAIRYRMGVVSDYFDIKIRTWIAPYDVYELAYDDEDMTRTIQIEISSADVLAYCLKQDCDPKFMAHTLINYTDNVIKFEYGGANKVEF